MEIKILNTIGSIAKSQWAQITPKDFPFYDFEFLQALEVTGCVNAASGWEPFYLTAWEGDCLQAAMVLYRKTNSYGEYIFDWAYAELAERMGIAYYPKWVAAVPFTPATGAKVLMAQPSSALRVAMIQHMQRFCRQPEMSSEHVLFLEAQERGDFESQGYLIRQTHQFHWANAGYESFQHFLDRFPRKKRQNIARERASIGQQNLRIETFTGAQLTAAHGEIMWRFYQDTIRKNHAIAYLSQPFFRELFQTFGHAIYLVLAFQEKQCVAGAIFFKKGEALFGRYWGCERDFKNLHFELCYYQGIDLAIQQGLRRFEAGAQGPHKIARGFLPAYTYSAHWFANAKFHALMTQVIFRENAALEAGFREFAPHSPFR